MSSLRIFIYILSLLCFNLLNEVRAKAPQQLVPIEVQTSEVDQRAEEIIIDGLYDYLHSKYHGYKDGHEWVDLGLPSKTKWATLNVGAKDEMDYGDYFSWGETKVKNVYNEETSLTSGVVLRRISGKPRYDAVTYYWGKNWRLPTEDQIVELINYTDSQEIENDNDGIVGVRLTSKINGQSIFFPSGGMKGDDMTYAVGDLGFFWSGSEFSTVWEKACFLMISVYGARLTEDIRCVGANVRGVTR